MERPRAATSKAPMRAPIAPATHVKHLVGEVRHDKEEVVEGFIPGTKVPREEVAMIEVSWQTTGVLMDPGSANDNICHKQDKRQSNHSRERRLRVAINNFKNIGQTRAQGSGIEGYRCFCIAVNGPKGPSPTAQKIGPT